MNFLNLVDEEKVKLFDTLLVGSLFDTMWNDFFVYIRNYFYIPFMLYLVSAWLYFYYNLQPVNVNIDKAENVHEETFYELTVQVE